MFRGFKYTKVYSVYQLQVHVLWQTVKSHMKCRIKFHQGLHCLLKIKTILRDITTTVRTRIQWTTLFCVYFVMCRLIAQWPSKSNASIHRLIGFVFFVTKCIVKWAVIWWNLFTFEHLHFLIYPKCTFVRITAFSLLSINNYTVL